MHRGKVFGPLSPSHHLQERDVLRRGRLLDLPDDLRQQSPVAHQVPLDVALHNALALHPARSEEDQPRDCQVAEPVTHASSLEFTALGRCVTPS